MHSPLFLMSRYKNSKKELGIETNFKEDIVNEIINSIEILEKVKDEIDNSEDKDKKLSYFPDENEDSLSTINGELIIRWNSK